MELTENQKKMLESISSDGELDNDSLSVTELQKLRLFGRQRAIKLVAEKVASGEWEKVVKRMENGYIVTAYRPKRT